MKDKVMKVSPEFELMLKKIANTKVRNGTANIHKRETFSTRRLTLAMARHQDISKLIKDIEMAEWDGDKPSKWQ
jgi:hypothetical protein|tara:strand:- start:388 stop:609 length:222 start_codon:yes stop_codon:yes gene_type:complete